MGLKNVRNKKLIYHLTKLRNLDSILKYGLLSRSLIEKQELSFDDVADPQIISKRDELGLQCYVPFHFHPYSSFDKAVKSNFHNEEFIYICITRELASKNKFKILLSHPLSQESSKLFDYDEGIEKIDWNAMETLGTEDEHIKNVKMAECLTKKIIPAKYFNSIFVRNNKTKSFVENKLREFGVVEKPPYVNVQNWFD